MKSAVFQGVCICRRKQRQYACVLTMFLEAYTDAFPRVRLAEGGEAGAGISEVRHEM